MKVKRSFLIPAAFAVLVLIWGTTWAAIRVGLEGIPPFTGVAARFALAGGLLFAAGRLLGVEWQGGPRVYRVWTVVTIFSFCLSYGIVYWAEQWITSGLASVLFATFPLFVAVLAHLWLPAEPFDRRELSGMVMGLVGVVALFSDDVSLGSRAELVAAVVMLGSPAAAAVSNVLVKKWGAGIHPINVTALPMTATGAVMGLVAWQVEAERPVDLNATAVAALLYLAVLGSAVTFTIHYWLLERVAATRLSLLTLAIPVVAVATGVLFLDEPLSVRAVFGAALVLTGVWTSSRARGATPSRRSAS